MTLTVTITGQRGTGKSRLAARIRNQLVADGFNCHKIEERQPPANTGTSFVVFEAVSVLNQLDASKPQADETTAQALIKQLRHIIAVARSRGSGRINIPNGMADDDIIAALADDNVANARYEPTDADRAFMSGSSVGTPQQTNSEAVAAPADAVINGRTHAERVEATEFACEAGPLINNYDWLEFKRCFEILAQHVEALKAADTPSPQNAFEHLREVYAAMSAAQTVVDELNDYVSRRTRELNVPKGK